MKIDDDVIQIENYRFNMKKKLNWEQNLDDEEKEFIASEERGEWIDLKGKKLEKMEKYLSDSAKRAVELMKKQQISINLEKQDLLFVKEKALKTGIPYQKIIGYLIKQYREGKINLQI